MKTTEAIPWSLLILRVLGCPVIVVGTMRGWDGGWLGAIVVAALFSDIYDGMLARRWGCERVALRLWDSVADTIFYLGVVDALWVREPEVLRGNWQLFAVLFGLEGGRYVFDLWKFRKAASYHSYLAKAWGLLIAVAMVGALSVGRLAWPVRVAVVFGIVVNLEGLAMSLMLPPVEERCEDAGKSVGLAAGDAMNGVPQARRRWSFAVDSLKGMRTVMPS